MLTKNECDLIWKIRHGAIPTCRFMYGCKYSDSPNCNYCGELDNLTHIFVILRIHVMSPILGERISAIILPQQRKQWLW